jgi:hypothetical protein
VRIGGGRANQVRFQIVYCFTASFVPILGAKGRVAMAGKPQHVVPVPGKGWGVKGRRE